MYHLIIDDKEIEVLKGTTVLNAARLAGVEIPTLCDHPALEPYGGCRLCLVEIEGARTLQPACTLPASNNMVIHTQTKKVTDARKFVLSMLFSERNHFCPYCQVSGGDCELQNAAYDEEMTHWPLQPNWNHFEVDASHPYFILDHNRCILCRRCVRACAELVGNYTLGMEERGSKTMLTADLGVPLGSSSCVSCGVCVQICPTGALIDRWSAYRGHETDVQKTDTICVGCSLGCGIDVITRNNSLVRIDGDWDAEINGGVLCEVGRFLPMNDSRQKLVTPLIRRDGSLKAATWDEAMTAITDKLHPLLNNNRGGIAAIISTRLPIESLHLFKQIFADNFGSKMVTSTEEGYYTVGFDGAGKQIEQQNGLNAIGESDLIMTIGVDLSNDHQVAGFFVKRSIEKGTRVIPIHTEKTSMDSLTPYDTLIQKGSELNFVQALNAKLNGEPYEEKLSKSNVPVSKLEEIANLLKQAENALIIFGSEFSAKNKPEVVQAIIQLAKNNKINFINFKGKANSYAAANLGLDSKFVVNNDQVAYLTLGDEEPSQLLLQRVENAAFTIVHASYHSAVTAMADVVLPVTNWLEQDGHYISADGIVQKALVALQPSVDVRSNQDILEDLATRLQIEIDNQWLQSILQSTASAEVQPA